jgi:hypothetical protein
MLALVVKAYPHVNVPVRPVLHTDLHTGSAELIFAGLAAGGTLVLAIATWKLARRTAEVATQTRQLATETAEVASQTRQLARETTGLAQQTSQDVAAQFRPVLVSDLQLNNDPVTYSDMQGLLRLRIHNSGHGPALNIQALVPQNGVAADAWQRGALATDGRAWLEFRNVWEVEHRITAELQYRSWATRPTRAWS